MARQLSFDEMERVSSGKRAQFFGLADDGDKAIVRFYHVNGDDIEKLAVHRVDVGDRKGLAVACIRDIGGDTADCPLCENGNSVSARMYLKILVYEKDKDGYYTKPPQLTIWERGSGFRKTMQSLINRYASGGKALMDTIFEIERNGKKGDQKTQYSIYKVDDLEADECPLPAEDEIEDITVLGTIVQDRDYDELNFFLDNGEFPPKENNSSERSAKRDEQPVVRRSRVEEAPAEQPTRTNREDVFGEDKPVSSAGARPRRTRF